jgi:hypothetical protein
MNRNGCLMGILKLSFLSWLFDWLQDTFGFGRGCSCTGCGCGCLLTLIFLALACTTILSTDWTRIVHLVQGLI